MRDPGLPEVLKAIDIGIRNAQENYKDAAWTPLLYCPEYLMTVYVFNSLLSLTRKDSLTLESEPDDLLINYLGKEPRRGRPKRVPRGNGRVDICLWHLGEDRPRAIIEVKRCAKQWINNNDDIKRIVSLLHEPTVRKIEFGVLASCIHMLVRNNNETAAQKNIKNKLREIQQSIEANLDGRLAVKLEPSGYIPLQLKDEYPEDDTNENWIWRPVVFKIYRKRNRP